MAQVRRILDEIWERLRQANVGNDLAIIEYIAALLIQDKPWPFAEEQRPQKPKVRYNPDDDWLMSRLRFAAEQINGQNIDDGIAKLFNRHLLFHTSRSQEEGSYPTPRHIVEFMINLLQIEPRHSFADFACGSGGFLVQRYQNENNKLRHSVQRRNVRRGKSIGVDISPNWTRIALANLLLHQITTTQVEIHTGDIVRLCGPGGELKQDTFDRIAVSPPLDITIDASPIQKIFPELRQTKGQLLDSDNIFTYLLQRKLSPNGKGALLVSTSTVTRYSSKSLSLRQELIENREVQAVITLNADALNPFSKEAAHVLLINKQLHDAVWFFQVQKDGYDLGRKRDLTQPPDSGPVWNDLPLVEYAANITGEESDLQWVNDPKHLISYHIIYINSVYIGCIVKANQQTYIQAIEYKKRGSHVSADITTYNGDKLPIRFPDTNQISTDRKTIFRGGIPGQLIAITPDGRLIGITIPMPLIGKSKNNLLPEEHFSRHTPDNKSIDQNKNISAPTQSQEQLESAFSDELEILQPKPSPQSDMDTLPSSPVEPEQPFEIPRLASIAEPTQILGDRQKRIWSTIKRRFSTEIYSLPFTTTQLIHTLTEAEMETESENEEVTIPEIISSLTLFERLGLIVRVQLSLDQDRDIARKTYYRRITRQDIAAKISTN